MRPLASRFRVAAVGGSAGACRTNPYPAPPCRRVVHATAQPSVAREPLSAQALGEKARLLRVETLKMTFGAGSGHPGGSFSMAEFLVALYYNKIHISPQNPKDPDRDIFILSKGHCAPGLYAVLGDLGFFPKTEFTRLRKFGGLLQGHAFRKS